MTQTVFLFYKVFYNQTVCKKCMKMSSFQHHRYLSRTIMNVYHESDVALCSHTVEQRWRITSGESSWRSHLNRKVSFFQSWVQLLNSSTAVTVSTLNGPPFPPSPIMPRPHRLRVKSMTAMSLSCCSLHECVCPHWQHCCYIQPYLSTWTLPLIINNDDDMICSERERVEIERNRKDVKLVAKSVSSRPRWCSMKVR